jgi:DNA-binding transcriptional LysR family regulator
MNEISQTVNPLDSRQLNAFVTLIRTGSFAKTACHLCLTQSAISHSMRALELEIGCRLLVKMGKTIIATEAGEALLHHAQLGLKEFSAGREKLEKIRTWGTRRLRVGAGSAVGRRLLPSTLIELRRKHPRVVVTVKTVHPSRQTEYLQNGELDCVIGEEQDPQPDVEFTQFFESQLHLVVPANHRWVAKQHVPLEEFSQEPCVLPERFSPVRQLIEAYYFREKRPLNVVLEVENLETIREMVKAGLGIGILPAWVIQDDLNLGNLKAFAAGRRMLSLGWGLHSRRNRTLDLIQSDFRALCAETAKELFAPQAAVVSAPAG